MHYRAKEFPHPMLVADADSLMREMNRAMFAVDGAVDQNNLKDEGVTYPLVRDAMGHAYMRSTSIVGDNNSDGTGRLFAAVQDSGAAIQELSPSVNAYNGSDDEADRNINWEWIERAPDLPLTIELELRELTRVYVVLSGNAQMAIQSGVVQGVEHSGEFEVRLLVNNRPLDEMATFSCLLNGGFMPFHISTLTVMRPGLNVVKAQVRDRTYRLRGVVASNGLKIDGSYIYCYGHTR